MTADQPEQLAPGVTTRADNRDPHLFDPSTRWPPCGRRQGDAAESARRTGAPGPGRRGTPVSLRTCGAEPPFLPRRRTRSSCPAALRFRPLALLCITMFEYANRGWGHYTTGGFAAKRRVRLTNRRCQ